MEREEDWGDEDWQREGGRELCAGVIGSFT